MEISPLTRFRNLDSFYAPANFSHEQSIVSGTGPMMPMSLNAYAMPTPDPWARYLGGHMATEHTWAILSAGSVGRTAVAR